MDWAYLLNGFHGRIGRQTFWFAMGVLAIAEIFGHLIAEQIQGDRLSAIVDLAFTYPEFAVAVKRAHDRNMPVWLLMIFFGAGALLDLFTVLGVAGNDEAPSMLSLVIAVPFTVFRAGVACRAWFSPRHGRPEPEWSRSAGQGLDGHDCRSRRHCARSYSLPLDHPARGRRARLFAGRVGDSGLCRSSHDLCRARHIAGRKPLRTHRRARNPI